MDKVIVKVVGEAPAIGKPQMMGGIRSKEEAEAWAVREGYTLVYLWKARERVYADKLTKRVDVLAEQIQTKSGRLLELSQVGQGWAEWLIIAALLVLVIIFAGDALGWAW